MFEINNVFYIVGRKGISTLNNEFYKFPSNKEYNWCYTCRVGNNILVYYDDHVENSLFNPINKQWSDANIKINRMSFPVVYYLNKIWIIGGQQRDDDGKWKTFNTAEIYDSVAKNQILAPIKTIQPRSRHRVIVYKNKLFLFGGCENDAYLNSVEMFSPGTNKFVMMEPMKIARCDFACCRVGNLVYIVGGWICGGEHTTSVEVYNLDTNAWTDGVDIPVAGHIICGCAVKDKL